MSDVLPPIDELLAEFDSGKIPRSDTWHTLITGLYFNFDSVNEIENWYNTVQELTSFNQDLANKIQQNHDQVEIWHGEVDTWQQQVASHTQQAANSASAAEASETAAASSASTASTAAGTATQQSSAAEASATKAKASETASASSASQAEASATSAGSSAANALKSEQAAKGSETSAQYAASGAQTSEHNSEENATKAQASETAAAGSATTASQQAGRSETEADRSEAAAEKLNREGIPIGAIMPYYGSSAPMGWLGLTKGAKISKADYPSLFKHLTNQRQPVVRSENLNVHSINKIKVGNNTNLYLVLNDSVFRVEATVGITSTLTVISGTLPAEGVHLFSVYLSLIDIPLPNEECFLPDAANNFIKGYDPSSTRPIGTFEQDAIRNITGRLISGLEYGSDVFSVDSSGSFIVSGQGHTGWRANTVSGQPFNEGKRNFADLDTSKVVTTGPENVPKNLNCLWIIKAYDAVNDPEQLQAKAVIDQVNGNSSDILSINGELDRIGYALLDFGTVNTNSRYIQPNPFGNNTPVISIAEIQNNGKFANTGWIYSTGSGGSFGVKGSYFQNEGIVVQTGNIRLGDLPATTGTANDNSLVLTALCRVHVWRVKG